MTQKFLLARHDNDEPHIIRGSIENIAAYLIHHMQTHVIITSTSGEFILEAHGGICRCADTDHLMVEIYRVIFDVAAGKRNIPEIQYAGKHQIEALHVEAKRPIKILLELMDMPNMKMLLGNHEYMMRNTIRNPDDWFQRELWYQNGGEVTWHAWTRLEPGEQSRILEFLDGLPLNLEVPVIGADYLMVHGAPEDWFYTSGGRYRDPVEFAVWERLSYGAVAPEGKTIIFGHTPTRRYQRGRPMRIWYGNRLIGIDCGCAYDDGCLACLRLDDMQEFYSK